MGQKDLEDTLKEKVTPLLEETMEKSWGITIPQLESDITDKLLKPQIQVYVPTHFTFNEAKKFFKLEFIKKELRLHQGNISQLAKTLDIDRRSIHRAIKDLDIDMDDIRHKEISKDEYKRDVVDHAIRTSLDSYKEIIHPEKMDVMYGKVENLSRNIAKFLPHMDLTWKEAEREFEKQFFFHALLENEWNVARTAEQLEIRAETLHRKIKKLNLKKD